jgi:hypothetical protein
LLCMHPMYSESATHSRDVRVVKTRFAVYGCDDDFVSSSYIPTYNLKSEKRITAYIAFEPFRCLIIDHVRTEIHTLASRALDDAASRLYG